jgi:hypothetical protein
MHTDTEPGLQEDVKNYWIASFFTLLDNIIVLPPLNLQYQ